MNEVDIATFLIRFVEGADPASLLVLNSREHAKGAGTYRRFPMSDMAGAIEWVMAESEAQKDLYYKTALLKPDAVRMVKEAFEDEVRWLWSDVDDGDLSGVVPPTITVQSSPGRLQALWRLLHPAPKYEAEAVCRALAQHTKADASGWDLGQELRIPGTHNHKYEGRPQITATYTDVSYGSADFPSGEAVTYVESPEDVDAPDQYQGAAPSYAMEQYMGGGAEKRSGTLWQAINRLREDGFTSGDAFSILWWSPLNKYRADRRPPRDLWRDIAKAYSNAVQGGGGQVAIWGGDKLSVRGADVPRKSTAGGDDQLDWPGLVQAAIEWIRPGTNFKDEPLGLMFLSAFSAGFSRLRIGNMNTGLWVMLLASQASGKSTAISEYRRVVMDADPALQLVTSGSPEGIAETVSKGPTLITFEEYSDQLKLHARADSYAAVSKELFLKLFDGQPIAHATRKAAIRSEGEVFAVILAATNVGNWKTYGNAEDISNGYLSRFVVIAEDATARSVNHSGIRAGRLLLAPRVATAFRQAGSVTRVEFSCVLPQETVDTLTLIPSVSGFELSFGDGRLEEYQRELETRYPTFLNLDEAVEVDTSRQVPPGRTLMKTRKLATLLELAEDSPQIYLDRLYVRPLNIERAIRITEHAQDWADRSIGWLQESADQEYVTRIQKVLGNAYPEWVRPWDIAVRIRGLRAAQVKQLLAIMHESGMVEKQMAARANGQKSELWRAVND